VRARCFRGSQPQQKKETHDPTRKLTSPSHPNNRRRKRKTTRTHAPAANNINDEPTPKTTPKTQRPKTLKQKTKRPDKNAAEGGVRQTDAFVEERRCTLERWLNRLAAHPAVGASDALRVFLEAEGDLSRDARWAALQPPPAASVLEGASRAAQQLLGRESRAVDPVSAAQPASRSMDLLRAVREAATQMRAAQGAGGGGGNGVGGGIGGGGGGGGGGGSLASSAYLGQAGGGGGGGGGDGSAYGGGSVLLTGGGMPEGEAALRAARQRSEDQREALAAASRAAEALVAALEGGAQSSAELGAALFRLARLEETAPGAAALTAATAAAHAAAEAAAAAAAGGAGLGGGGGFGGGSSGGAAAADAAEAAAEVAGALVADPKRAAGACMRAGKLRERVVARAAADLGRLHEWLALMPVRFFVFWVFSLLLSLRFWRRGPATATALARPTPDGKESASFSFPQTHLRFKPTPHALTTTIQTHTHTLQPTKRTPCSLKIPQSNPSLGKKKGGRPRPRLTRAPAPHRRHAAGRPRAAPRRPGRPRGRRRRGLERHRRRPPRGRAPARRRAAGAVLRGRPEGVQPPGGDQPRGAAADRGRARGRAGLHARGPGGDAGGGVGAGARGVAGAGGGAAVRPARAGAAEGGADDDGGGGGRVLSACFSSARGERWCWMLVPEMAAHGRLGGAQDPCRARERPRQ